jgi:hypothetical protein
MEIRSKKPRPPLKGLDFSVAGDFNMNYFSAMLGMPFGLEKTET